ncbi:nudC domain-containing protein 2 [Dama dama]|uniref:nudC domain-containing protein 2 n=1 Tax=Dama dama TaxID=30532 RepID=UPI002A35EE0D|nr:nudC domain-containing protein 2 [Dama dama]
MRTFLDFSSLNLGPASVLNGQLKGKRADKRRPQVTFLRMCSDPSGDSRGVAGGGDSGRELGLLGATAAGRRLDMSAPFEERSGVVPCGTPWGQWYQTLEEVFIEVQVPPGTRAQDIQCGLQSRHVALAVGGREILKGKLFDSTIADEGTWTLEDRKMVRIVLTKTKRDAANCWTSLLESDYAADPWVQDQMQRKLTLERFQKENPGFDFSGAEISGNYTKGGPDFSNLEK